MNAETRIERIEAAITPPAHKEAASLSDGQLLVIVCDGFGKKGKAIRARGVEGLTEAELLKIIKKRPK
jgi:hypothetical protein